MSARLARNAAFPAKPVLLRSPIAANAEICIAVYIGIIMAANLSSGAASADWNPRLLKINCTNRTVSETLLKDVALKAMNCLISDGDAFIEQMQKNITMAIAESDTASPTAIQKRMDELQKELIDKATIHQHYDTIADEIFRLREQTEEAERHEQRQQEKLEHLKELQDFIQKQPTQLTELNDATIRKAVEKIAVFPDHFIVRFKSGIEVNVNE
jgi:site-specific DNA recombinase